MSSGALFPGLRGSRYITKAQLLELMRQLAITALEGEIDDRALQSDLLAHVNNVLNPHVVTKTQVGLGNVDNPADLDKPISTAVQAELDKKANHGYVDIDFPIIIRTTGGGRPSFATLTGDLTAPQWAVGNWLQIEGQEIVHGYKEGTPIQWHAHVLTGGVDVVDRYFRLEVKWAWVNAFGQLSAQITTTSPDLLIPANTGDRTMIPVVIDLVDMPTMEFGAHTWARLERVAAVGTAPTADIFLSMLQLHVDTDKYGVDDLPGGP